MSQPERFDTQVTTRSFESPFPTSSYSSASEVSYEEEDSSLYTLQEYDSPFNSVYRLSEWEESETTSESGELAEFVSELYDEEFNETLSEIVAEVADTYRTQFESEYGDPIAQQLEAERYFEEEFEPLVGYVNFWVDHLAEEEESGNLDSLSLEEFEQFIEQFEPPFEHGWFKRKAKKLKKKLKNKVKKLKNKVVKTAKNALKNAKKLAKKGLKFVQDKVIGKLKKVAKRIFPTLLKKILKVGMKLLPSKYRPIAKIVSKLFLKKEVAEQIEKLEFEAVEDVALLQSEFDLQVAQLFLVNTEEEEETICTEYEESLSELEVDRKGSASNIVTLERARSEFMLKVADLEEGENLAPIIENFANTVRLAIKGAIRLIGRGRVIKLLAKILTPLIGKLIKKVPKKVLSAGGLSRGKASSLLSRALIDVGLRLFNWEMSPEDERMLGPAAIAATVEDVVRQVGQLPEYVLDDEDLLSGQIMEAFERSAAANLPPILPKEVYEENPELTEAFHTSGCWVFYPYWGQKPFICKKYSRVFEVEITPQIAELIRTRDGKKLSARLRKLRRLKRRKIKKLRRHLRGLKSRGIKAKLHLHEAIPGTVLSQVATQEQKVLGDRVGSQFEFHPLTPEIAGLLLQEPGLGRDVSPQYMERPSRIAVGQRFYSLELLDDLEPEIISEWEEGEAAPNRLSELSITLDFRADQIRVAVFLSEGDAQAIATKLRQRKSLGSTMKLLRPILKEGIEATLSERSYGAMKILGGGISPIDSPKIALQMLSSMVKERMAAKLLEWLEVSILQHLRDLPKTLISAAEDPQDGITLKVFLNSPPGFQELGKTLRMGVQIQGADFSGQPGMNLKIVSGYSRE